MSKPHVLILKVGSNIRKSFYKSGVTSKYKLTVHSLSKPMRMGPSAYVKQIVNDFDDKKLEIDGIVGLTDTSGLIASKISDELNLISPSAGSLLNCQNKYFSRKIQKEHLPGQTPDFWLLDSEESLEQVQDYPVFIKPVKGSLSFFSHKINTKSELNEKFRMASKKLPLKNKFYKEILKTFDTSKIYIKDTLEQSGCLLAEELINGEQITVDGFVFNNKVSFFGITKSNFVPGTLSFNRFDYPYSFDESIVGVDGNQPYIDKKVYEIVESLIKSVGLNNSLFNVELMMKLPPRGGNISIVEINSRPSSQFMSMIYKVTGYHPIEAALDISVGKEPDFDLKNNNRVGDYKICSCFILRRKQDAIVKRAPSDKQISELESKFKGIKITRLAKEGKKLSSYKQDPQTFRYGQIKIPGNSLDEIKEKYKKIKEKLNYKFEDAS